MYIEFRPYFCFPLTLFLEHFSMSLHSLWRYDFYQHKFCIVWCTMIYVPISLMLDMQIAIILDYPKEFYNAHPYRARVFIFGGIDSLIELMSQSLLTSWKLKILSICISLFSKSTVLIYNPYCSVGQYPSNWIFATLTFLKILPIG